MYYIITLWDHVKQNYPMGIWRMKVSDSAIPVALKNNQNHELMLKPRWGFLVVNMSCQLSHVFPWINTFCLHNSWRWNIWKQHLDITPWNSILSCFSLYCIMAMTLIHNIDYFPKCFFFLSNHQNPLGSLRSHFNRQKHVWVNWSTDSLY